MMLIKLHVKLCEILDFGEFFFSFPHPVTLAGILEMSTVYLPMNDNWNTYINQSETIYEDLQNENKSRLMNLASDASQLIHQQKYVCFLLLFAFFAVSFFKCQLCN